MHAQVRRDDGGRAGRGAGDAGERQEHARRDAEAAREPRRGARELVAGERRERRRGDDEKARRGAQAREAGDEPVEQQIGEGQRLPAGKEEVGAGGAEHPGGEQRPGCAAGCGQWCRARPWDEPRREAAEEDSDRHDPEDAGEDRGSEVGERLPSEGGDGAHLLCRDDMLGAGVEVGERHGQGDERTRREAGGEASRGARLLGGGTRQPHERVHRHGDEGEIAEVEAGERLERQRGREPRERAHAPPLEPAVHGEERQRQVLRAQVLRLRQRVHAPGRERVRRACQQRGARVARVVVDEEEHREPGQDEALERHGLQHHEDVAGRRERRHGDRQVGQHVLRAGDGVRRRVVDVAVEEMGRVGQDGVRRPAEDPEVQGEVRVEHPAHRALRPRQRVARAEPGAEHPGRGGGEEEGRGQRRARAAQSHAAGRRPRVTKFPMMLGYASHGVQHCGQR